VPFPALKTRPLGSSGLQVGRIGLGGMPLSLEGRPSENDAIKVIHAALDAGMTLLDTADAYCPDDDEMGHNERLIGKAVRSWAGNRDSVVIATKGGLQRRAAVWSRNGRPERLKEACENSLRALGTETVTVYQFHAPDDDVPFEDSVGALADLRKLGKILHVGLSNVSVELIRKAQKIVPIVSVQNILNVFTRDSMKEGVVAYCQENDIAFLAYSAVGGHKGHVRTPSHPLLRSLAEKRGVTPYQICLAWLLKISSAVLPIPGATKISSVLSSAAAADLELRPEDMAELENM
jgi:aryl-alcohol dehydrogenase-like predicted oxidoreductase